MIKPNCFRWSLILAFLLMLFTVDSRAEKPSDSTETKAISLFESDSLKGWQKTEFGSQAEISMQAGVLEIEMGAPMTGVTIAPEKFKTLPKINYEMSLEARRVVGGDFFVGLTFPVKEDSCSLIMGGWGGGVIGISSLDGYDASENETTTYHTFKNEQWYKIRLQVTEEKIVVWLDDEKVIDVELEDKKISTRIEVTLSEPLGLCTFETTAQLKNFQIRPLDAKAVSE